MIFYDIVNPAEPTPGDEERQLRDEGKGHTFSFCMWPRMWQNYHPLILLEWQTFHLSLEDANEIPNAPGVYAFLVKPSLEAMLGASYLIYVGKTSRTLRERFREYLREMDDPFGRAKVLNFLQRYNGHVHFSCSVIDICVVEPEAVENELLKALMPPANSEFPAEVSRIVPYPFL